MHVAGVDEPPAIAETVGIVAFHVEPLRRVVLQDGDGVVASFQQQIHRLGAELGRIEAVEQDRAPAALRVPDFRVKIASRADSPRR